MKATLYGRPLTFGDPEQIGETTIDVKANDIQEAEYIARLELGDDFSEYVDMTFDSVKRREVE